MRYSVAVKFLAIILCAASLLGAIGGGVGLFCLTELRGQTPEEAYTQVMDSYVTGYVGAVGKRYFSTELGGAHSRLYSSIYGMDWENQYFDWSRVGYTLKDDQGNVLLSQEIPGGYPAEAVVDCPVVGQYFKVISVTPYQEYYDVPEATQSFGEQIRVEVMPNQPVTEIYRVVMDYTDGNQIEYEGAEDASVGVLRMDDGSSLIFESNYIGEIPMGDGWYVNHILMEDAAGNVVYKAAAGDMIIRSMSQEGNWLELRLPAEEVTQLALTGVIFTDGDYEAYDAIPDAGITVAQMNVTYGNVEEGDIASEGVSSADFIGTLFHTQDGNVQFRSKEPMAVDAPEETLITHISFQDAQGNLVYDARCPGGVGSFSYDEDGNLIFHGVLPGREEVLPEETDPEEAAAGSTAVVVFDTVLYTAPNIESEEVAQLKAGQEIVILQTGSFQTGEEIQQWGLTEDGWILMDNVMLVMDYSADAKAEILPTEEDYRNIYAAPNLGADVLDTLEEGASPEILKQQEINGILWGLTPEGWILIAPPVVAKAVSEETPAADEETVPEETVEETLASEATAVPEQMDSETEPVTAAEEVIAEATEVPEYDPDIVRTAVYYDSELQQDVVAEYVEEMIPGGYTMELRLASGAMRTDGVWTLLRMVYAMKDQLLKLMGICIGVFAVTLVYLCCAAGRKKGREQPCAGGLNRLPLDLHICISVTLVAGLVVLAVEGGAYLMRNSQEVGIMMVLAVCYVIALVIIGFFFAFVAQVKTPGGFWWRNSLCGRCAKGILHGCKWLTGFCEKSWHVGKPLTIRFFHWLWDVCVALWLFAVKILQWLWDTGKRLSCWLWLMVKKMWSWSIEKLIRFFGLLPITWQFLLTGFLLVFFLYVMLRSYKVGWILVGFGVFFAVILYAASAFAILLESAKRMRRGDLDTKVDDRMLIGGFKDFSEELNGLAGVAVVAAQKQLKSERMKTELITNVSHDIKTPLTSIINYVDLLQKPHTEQEQAVYLEVLSRQSQRLKKMVDDLMEMSKASTGNLAVEITRMDAGEAINQALGEFADKLERAELTPVFRQPVDKVEMMADGRLVWRVMSNLLSNASKYALPGTRIYIDLLQMDGKVIISMKNISREELNVNAEELMERFVRGDASRNTEGSGLGLNIALSLMELQKGQLQLLVDGDLFKVTLIFPGV